MSKHTIQDVARKARVGVGTVSRVLNNHPSVRKSTRDKVLEAIEELGYAPNPHARRIAGGRSYTVSVMLPMVSVEFYVRLVNAIEECLDENRFDMAIFPLLGRARIERYLNSNRIAYQADGIIMCTYDLGRLFPEGYLPTEHPVVLVDNESEHYDSVFLDNYYGGYLVGEYAARLGLPAYTMSLEEDPEGVFVNQVFVDRKRGFDDGLASSNIQMMGDFPCGLHHQGGAQASQRLLDEAVFPCTVFAAADVLAGSLIEEAGRRGLVVGRDIKVIGFDDQPWSQDMKLTTVHQPIEVMGRRAAEMLLERLSGYDGPPRKARFTPHLVERDSTLGEVLPAKYVAIAER